jgi:hypothetical protein
LRRPIFLGFDLVEHAAFELRGLGIKIGGEHGIAATGVDLRSIAGLRRGVGGAGRGRMHHGGTEAQRTEE